MNAKSLKHKEYEMRSIWNSLSWSIKEKLVSIDNNTRAMIAEMRTFSVPEDVIAEFLPRAFAELMDEVLREQKEKYDGGQVKEKCE